MFMKETSWLIATFMNHRLVIISLCLLFMRKISLICAIVINLTILHMNSLKKHVKLVYEKPFDNKQSLKEYARFVINFIGNMRKQRHLNVQNVIGILKTNVL
jgi:hypothetical protein